MKFTTLFKSAAALLMGAVMFSCTPNENGDGDGDGTGTGAGKEELNENLEFTLELVAEDLDTDSAKIKVSHNGQKTDTWYGFVTTETDIDDAILDEVESLLQEDGTIASTKLKKSTSTNVNLRELEPATEYTYVVFGLSEKGTVYGTPESLEFTTKSEFTGLTETQDWVLNYGGRDDEGKEHFTVECAESSIYLFDYVDEYYITDYESGKSYLYEYILAEAETFIGYLEEVTVEQLLEVGYFQQGPAELVSQERLATGNYYLFAIGFNEDGTPTGTYSTQKFEVEEEEATAEYLQWIGNYTFTGANDISYDIKIEAYDNNYMYAVTGWETGSALDETGMDFGTAFGEWQPVFPAYFKGGKLQFAESYITQLTVTDTSNQEHETLLGFFGYDYSTDDGLILITTDESVIATAETTDNGSTGNITGESIALEGGEETSIKALGYAAIATAQGDDNIFLWNEPMKLPITMTKKAEAVTPQQSMKPASMSFNTKFNAEKPVLKASMTAEKKVKRAVR